MRHGLSTNRHCHPFADCLAANQKQFVIRYHSRTTTQPQKRISPKEAADLARAGLDIATVYQDNARLLTDFGQARGVLDGTSAQQAAAVIGQPAGSAIYFAVDEDFSSAQIQAHVVPYFVGVRQGMEQAAGGASPYKIGVYGSGLTCQLVRDELALATFAWLAAPSGWRGSSSYTGWDVRQRLPQAALCGLGMNWEPCEAPGRFGQFRPIGFELHADEGTPMWVTASQLNLRAAPTTASAPPITQLPEGQRVRVLGPATGSWVRVRATVGGGEVIGYVNGKYLAAQAMEDVPVPAAGAVPAVHYREGDAQSRRSSVARRAQPLGEVPHPVRHPHATPAQRAEALGAIVGWLDVERSARYLPEAVTFCNVYAADFCYLAQVYLPRTWWTSSALMAIATGQTPPVAYGTTIREMRADDLYAWLAEFGPAFGWRRVFDPTALQAAANGGGVGLIVADRLEAGRPGHITVVVPETGTRKAVRDGDGNVIFPLQTQAGARNHAYSTIGSDWWNHRNFADEDGFFIHD